jgi:hypothetical protein
MDSIRAGRTIPAKQVQAEMTEFKKSGSSFHGVAGGDARADEIATGKEERHPELDTFAAAFAVAGENQAADERTLVLLKRF